MANKSSIQTNAHRLALSKRFAKKRARLKAMAYDKKTSVEDRFHAALKLAALPRNSAKIRYRHRCILTGRPRGFHREYGLSRIMFRELASSGQIPGVYKASW